MDGAGRAGGGGGRVEPCLWKRLIFNGGWKFYNFCALSKTNTVPRNIINPNPCGWGCSPIDPIEWHGMYVYLV